MKWQITEPGIRRWTEKIFVPNFLNINIGKYESLKKILDKIILAI